MGHWDPVNVNGAARIKISGALETMMPNRWLDQSVKTR